ncbi:MAG: hypothetical protein OEZ59_10975 [Deltaproteobacteria bacterium]|nr:hypothetical protein [Deltaproteobacteria bacterium]
MSTERIFNPRSRKVLRKHIGPAEALSSALVLTALALVVGWVALNPHDPASRDLDHRLLATGEPEKTLYRPPPVPWTDPAAPAMGAGAGAAGGGVDMAPFPMALLAGGWTPGGRVRGFGPDNLYEKINGEAEKFIRQDFRALHYLVLKGPGGAELSIELFDQGSLPGSLGVFSDHRTPDKQVKLLAQPGPEPRPAGMYFPTSGGGIGMAGRYFFRLAGTPATEDTSAKALQVMTALAGLAGNDPGPLLYRVLTGPLGISPAGLDYVRDNVFQYDFAREFWFGSRAPEKPGAAAPPPGAGSRWFLHQAENPAAAQALRDRLLTEGEMEYESLRQQENMSILRHRYLGTHMALGLGGRFICGVENAAAERGLEGELRKCFQALARMNAGQPETGHE